MNTIAVPTTKKTATASRRRPSAPVMSARVGGEIRTSGNGPIADACRALEDAGETAAIVRLIRYHAGNGAPAHGWFHARAEAASLTLEYTGQPECTITHQLWVMVSPGTWRVGAYSGRMPCVDMSALLHHWHSAPRIDDLARAGVAVQHRPMTIVSTCATA